MGPIVRALLIVSLSSAITPMSGYAAQTANQKVCTTEDLMRALDESDRLKDWDAAYRFFKTSGHCDSGAVAEGVDDSVVRLLVKAWESLDALARLAANDKKFENFVLHHIDELASEQELKAISQNARSHCPQGQKPLCARIDAAVSSVLAQPDVLLGALEDVPGRFANQPSIRTVRVLFGKHGDEWTPFRSDCRDAATLKTIASEYPQAITWSIAFNGKNLGQVNSHAPEAFDSCARVGLEEITSTGPGTVPTAGQPSVAFSGFAEQEVYRPLVVVSSPNYKDPEVWRPAKPADEVIAALRQEFRKKFPSVSNCTNPDENVLKPWRFRDEDIAVGKAYSSQKRWFVAGMKLDEYRCDGPIAGGGPFDLEWFVIAPDGTIRFLDSGMWLVDAGDYDNDGKSELVFGIARYDAGGYEIFYDQFRKKAVFQFIYH